MEYRIWEIEYEMRNVGYGTWNVPSKKQNMRCENEIWNMEHAKCGHKIQNMEHKI